MLDPYRMIVINLASSIFLLSVLIIYKFIYPRRKINLLALLILISILPLISILRKGTYESGDLSLHAGFAMSFFESIKEGILVPKWNSNVIYGYGYPLFIFIYPLPYYLSSFIHFLGFSFIDSLKLILAISYVLSGITMYFFVKEELRNKFSAFFAGVIYLFSPYHLVDLHFRVAIGEVIAFAILPFCFFSIKKMSYGPAFFWFFYATISFSALILSHQAISLASIPFIIIYCLYLCIKRSEKRLSLMYSYFFFFAAAILLSSFYWLPVIFEAKYTNLLTKGVVSFISFSQLIYSPWRMGMLFQGHKGELSFIVGYAQWFIVLFSIFLFFRKMLKEKKLYLISISSFFALLLLTQSFSSPIWNTIPLLNGFQFSYRLLLLVSFTVAVIGGIIAKNIKNKKFLIILCLITIFTTILNWGNRKTLPLITDSVILSELPKNTTKVGPGITVWVDSDKFNIDERVVSHITVLNGKANISEISRTPEKHEYSIHVFSGEADIKENTLYFPGWTVKINGNSYPFSFKNKTYPGIIIFSLKKGFYKVEVIFTDTNIRKTSSLVSFITFTVLLALLGLKLMLPKR